MVVKTLSRPLEFDLTKSGKISDELRIICKKTVYVEYIRVGDIKPPIMDIRNRKTSADADTRRRESIKNIGMFSQITVNKFNGKTSRTVDGWSRHQDIVTSYGKDEIVACVVYEYLTETQEKVLNMVLNSDLRKNLNDTDLKNAIRILAQQGIKDANDMDAFIGKGKDWIEEGMECIVYEDKTGEVVKSLSDFQEGAARLQLNKDEEFKVEVQKELMKNSRRYVSAAKKKTSGAKTNEVVKARDLKRRLLREIRGSCPVVEPLYDCGLITTPKELAYYAIKVGEGKTIPIVPVGSRGKYSNWEHTLTHDRWGIIEIWNPDYPQFEYNGGILDGMVTLAIKHANGATIRLVDRDKERLGMFAKQKVTRAHKHLEDYLEKDFMKADDTRMLLLIHLSGNRVAREFIGEKILHDVKEAHPNLTLAFIITEEFSCPTSQDSNKRELMNTFGVKRSRKIKTIEDYLLALEEQMVDVGSKFEVIWAKTREEDGAKRRVALVVGEL